MAAGYWSMKKDGDFKVWLKEPCVWGATEEPRYRSIQRFIYEGLYPFIKEMGYEWICSEKELQNRIATGLFENRSKTHLQSNWSYLWSYAPCQSEEQRAHFHHVVSRQRWDAFWAAWGQWTDVCLDVPYGLDRRMDIEYYVWGELDLAISSQTRELEEIILGGESDEEDVLGNRTKPSVDIYIQEADYHGWGGYRH